MRQELIERVRQEVVLLAREIGGLGHSGDRVKVGRVTVGNKEYLGVIIENLGVNPQCFLGVKSVRALLLLPVDYPRVPPLGIYVNYRHSVVSSHFIGNGAEGAPDLIKRGWFWFCHGVGTFKRRQRRSLWRPAANPANGHNLATVVAAARVTMNSNE